VRPFARIAVCIVPAALAVAGLAPAAGAATEKELVGDAVAQAFTLRASADQGGASLLHFYFGSYADAYLSTPPSEADGQASWYNFGIAETALFKPPEECTPDKNAERVQEGLQFFSDWLVGQLTSGDAVQTLLEGRVPEPPFPALPCGGGRPPGFAQSRYPATESIGPAANDDLLVSSACRGEAACADALRTATGGAIQGGRFEAAATKAPSQSSDAVVAGLQLGDLLRIGTARSTASTFLNEAGRVTAVATWSVTDLCLMPGAEGCALEIDEMLKTARVVRSADGVMTEKDARTVIAGVHGSGQSQEITSADLGDGLPAIDLGDLQGCDGCTVQLELLSSTGGCGDPASDLVADTGGLRIYARGNGQLTLPVPIAGNAAGGGLMLGGACASGRVSSVDLEGPPPVDGDGVGPLGPAILPPQPPVAGAPRGFVGPVLSAPRVISRDIVRYVLRSAPAWRTAPYWGSALAAVLLLGALGYVFRRSPVVAPLARRIDRFARQFVRG
jgi:hypothetical protein